MSKYEYTLTPELHKTIIENNYRYTSDDGCVISYINDEWIVVVTNNELNILLQLLGFKND